MGSSEELRFVAVKICVRSLEISRFSSWIGIGLLGKCEAKPMALLSYGVIQRQLYRLNPLLAITQVVFSGSHLERYSGWGIH